MSELVPTPVSRIDQPQIEANDAVGTVSNIVSKPFPHPSSSPLSRFKNQLAGLKATADSHSEAWRMLERLCDGGFESSKQTEGRDN